MITHSEHFNILKSLTYVSFRERAERTKFSFHMVSILPKTIDITTITNSN